MSKREIRAKRLVAAVLLAISVQMWSAPPLWAAEASVQTETSAAGEAKETKDAKDAKAADSETGGEADADEGENVVVPVIGYSTRSAAGSDYGVVPLADMAVDGALTGVTGINGSELVVDKVNNNFFIGTIQDGGSFDKSSKNNAAIGLDIHVDSNGNSSVFGAAAKSWGESASVFGAGAESGEYGSVFGTGAEASEQYGSAFGAGALAGHSNTVAFGYSAKSTEWYSIAVGAEAKAEVTGGIAIGALANVGTGVKTYGSGIAIGMEAHTNNDLTIALGYNAESTFESSIAVGANSATTAAYQVAFGTGEVKTVDGAEVVTWTDRRSLAGISDIDMEGALTGVNKIDMKNGALTGVSTINGNVLVPMNEDVTNKSLAIGTGADFKSSYSSVTRIYKNAIAIGNGAYAGGNGSLAIGFDSNGNAASAGGVGSISLNAMASGDHNVIISGWADAYDSVVIGYGSSTDNSNVVAIGNGSYGGADGTVLGYAAGTDGRNSVAIGAKSSVASGDDDKVSFGHKVGDTNYADGSDYSDDLFRSLINVADIDMHGNISLGGEWSWNDAGTSYKSNGLGNLTGVIGINGIEFLNYDCGDGPVLAIGSTIGNDSTANSVGLGINNTIEGYGSVSIGVGTNVRGNDATGVGSGVSADGENSVAVGSNAFATADGATAVGSASRVYAEGGSALGYGTSVAAAHTNSVAIGAKSATGAANQVSFGHKVGDINEYGGSNFTDDLFRSLVNVADIEMHGALTGVTGIDGVTVSGTDASTGLTVGGNAVIGKTDTPFSSMGFAVAKDGAVTAKTVNGATITGTSFNGVTLSTDGKVNGAVITSNSFNGVKLEKGADSHYKVGDVDVTKMQTDVAGKADAATVTALDTRVGKSETDIGTLKTTVGDSSKGLVKDTADLKAAVGDSSKGLVKQVSDVDTAYKAADTVLQGRAKTLEDKTAGISRSGSTTTLETNTSVSSSGITTNKATVSGATATTLENGKLTVGAATVQNTGFAVGSSSLNNGSLTVDGNNKLTTAGLTASKVTVGAVTVSGGKVSGLTDAALSAVSTEAVTGKQLNATNTTVSALDTAYKAADTQIRTDFAAADTTLQNNIDAKVAQTAYDTKMSALDSADTALGSRAAALETAVNDSTTGLAAVNTKVGALDTAYQAADTQIRTDFAAADTALSNRAAALETVATGMSYDAGKNTTTFTGGVTATVLTAGEFKVGATGFGFGSDGALTAKTFNGIEIQKDESKVMVGGIDLTALSNGDVVTDNTKGIDQNQDTATTTIETNTKISSSGITTNAVTASGTVKAGEFVEGSQKLSDKYAAIGEAYTAEKAALKADKSDVDTLKTTIGDSTTGLAAVNTKVGALDTAYQAADTQIRTDFAAADNALKTELNTAIDEKAKKATDLAGYGITDAYTKNDADAKITAATADMATKTQLTADIGTAKTALENAYKAADTQIRTDFAAADTALSDRAAALETAATGMSYDADKATTTFAGGVTAAVLTAGELKVGATGFGFGSDGALTAKTVNGIEIKKDGSAVKVGGIDLTALSKGDVVTDNTKGIVRNQDTATTTIETNTAISSSGINTNAVTASGTVKASEFVEGDKKLSDKYAAKTALDDYTTTTDMNTKLADYATTTAVDTKLADYAKSDSVYSKAAADTAFAKADASNLPSDVSGWQSKLGISDISSKLAGFSYDNTSGTTTIGGVKLKGGTLADVKSLNGKAVGADSKGITIDGIGLKDLSERVTAIENNGGGGTGGSTADTEGIKRTDVADGSGKTTVEGATSFTKDGLKTANLEAATAALGGVNFAAGAVTGVSSINGISFADGKLGGVSLSGGKVNGADITSTSFNGVDVKALKNKVDNLTPGSGGGTGGGDNTGGISKPDGDTTNIEGNTSITTDGVETNKVTATDSITVADETNNKTTISDKGIVVAEGKKNQVTISEDGIHVGKNSSVVNDTDGFITDKGLYIGVSSSSDTSTAKFSVAPNGNLSSKAGDYGFSNTSADGAKFTHSGDTAYGTGSQLDTTIQGNKVTTGRVDTDELYVDGNKVTVAGGTIGQTDAVDNHLSGTDADGNTVTNDFKTSAVNGTTQAAEKTSADGKESTKTVNNTSAGGTGVTTSRTTTDSKDNVTVKESSFGTNEKGMTLSTSNKVTDKDGKVTKDTSGTTTMTGDSISVSKTTTTTEKDADGNEKEVTKTSGTTIGSGEVTLKREDGSTIEVGSAIEGMQSDMRELDGRVNRMGVEIKEVGALSAALAGLHPQPENANSRADFAMAMGSYEGKQALAVGGFYRPDKRTMLSIGASTTSSKHMMNMGISIALDRLPEAERRAKESKTDLAGRMKVLEADYESRLEKLEAAYEARLERLEARYARLQEAAEDKKETAAEQPQAEKPAESEVKGDEADRAVS